MIRVLIVDDHAIVRQGLRMVLDAHSEIEVVGEADGGEAALDMARTLKPDVILLDLVMPGMDGLETMRRLKTQGVTSRVLVLTSVLEDQTIQQALQQGANGYLLKASRSTDVIRAIQQVMQGQDVLDPAVTQHLIRQTRAGDPLDALTERERHVFDLMARGLQNPEIAARLNIGEVTVRTHVMNIFDKLNFRDRTQVMVYALKRGLVHLDDLE